MGEAEGAGEVDAESFSWRAPAHGPRTTSISRRAERPHSTHACQGVAHTWPSLGHPQPSPWHSLNILPTSTLLAGPVWWGCSESGPHFEPNIPSPEPGLLGTQSCFTTAAGALDGEYLQNHLEAPSEGRSAAQGTDRQVQVSHPSSNTDSASLVMAHHVHMDSFLCTVGNMLQMQP